MSDLLLSMLKDDTKMPKRGNGIKAKAFEVLKETKLKECKSEEVCVAEKEVVPGFNKPGKKPTTLAEWDKIAEKETEDELEEEDEEDFDFVCEDPDQLSEKGWDEIEKMYSNDGTLFDKIEGQMFEKFSMTRECARKIHDTIILKNGGNPDKPYYTPKSKKLLEPKLLDGL